MSNLITDRSLRCEQRDIDRYQRIVSKCSVGDTSINAWMAERGWAVAFRLYSGRFVPQEEVAKAGKRGMWRGSFTEPAVWRRKNRKARD